MSGSLLRAVALAVFFFALWCLLHRYWGLQHDAQLYVLQALGRLEPRIYGGDLFLRFAGKADWTLFPTISSFFIGTLGPEKGAALATLLMHALWFGAAWLLIRGLMDRSLALLALGLIVAIPVGYGSGQVFRLIEPFFSARPLAEALSLLALAALVSHRFWLAAALALLAMSIHPLMAFPVVLVMLLAAMPATRSLRANLLAGLVLIAGSVAGSALLGGAGMLMSGEWLELTRLRSAYLFVDTWTPGDWQTSLLPLVTLALASTALPDSSAKTIARSALIVGGTGLILTILSGGPIPLKLILQGQPWRWIWIGHFLALALLPLLIGALWKSDKTGRAAALFLVVSWMLSGWSSSDELAPVGAATLIAIGSLALWLARNRVSSSAVSVLLAGGWVAVLLTGAGLTASTLAVARGGFHFGTDPRWVELVTEIMKSFPPVAAFAVLLAWRLVMKGKTVAGPAIVAVVAAVVLITGAQGTYTAWTQNLFSSEDHSGFARWRERIPAEAEVLWPDEPQGSWFLLQRRNYLSQTQLAGIVFSGELAREARRRAVALGGFADPDSWFGKQCSSEAECLTGSPDQACAATGLDFVVLETEAGNPSARNEWPGPGQWAYLYDCAEFAAPGAR
jgi:hypothetical protein